MSVVETITVCIINLWGYTEMLRKFLLFSISIQKVFRDHSGLFALSYAFSSTLCSGAIEPFKQGFYQFLITDAFDKHLRIKINDKNFE